MLKVVLSGLVNVQYGSPSGQHGAADGLRKAWAVMVPPISVVSVPVVVPSRKVVALAPLFQSVKVILPTFVHHNVAEAELVMLPEESMICAVTVVLPALMPLTVASVPVLVTVVEPLSNTATPPSAIVHCTVEEDVVVLVLL